MYRSLFYSDIRLGPRTVDNRFTMNVDFFVQSTLVPCLVFLTIYIDRLGKCSGGGCCRSGTGTGLVVFSSVATLR